MNEKIKCPNCKLLIDDDSVTCPYCGYKIEHIEKEKNNEAQDKIEFIYNKKENKNETNYKTLIKFPSRAINLGAKNLYLFLVGFIGLSIISLILSTLLLSLNEFFALSLKGSGILNFASYFSIFGICFLILGENIKEVFVDFKKSRTYLYGFSYGFLLIAISVLINLITIFIFPNISSNDNQSSIDSITSIFPILSILVFGIIGPIVEELTYRVGLFTTLLKKNTLLAYLVSALVFGFLHFNFSSSDLILELINIPSYIISGLFLCYVYHKEGVGAAILCHLTNNLVSIILTIL